MTDAQRRQFRARRLALSVIDLGEPRTVAERQLKRWGFLDEAADAASWAETEHKRRNGEPTLFTEA